MGLKQSSMPFDWIFSSPEMIAHAIRDDFRQFLARDNISAVPMKRRPDPSLCRADNVFYRDRFGVSFIFNHHDPSENEDDYQYFVRCVHRFRALLRGEKVLFLLFKHLRMDPDNYAVAAYSDLASLLHPHDLLCVEISTRLGSAPAYEVIVSDDNLEVGRFRTSAGPSGVSFGCIEDYEAISALIRARAAGIKPEPKPLHSLDARVLLATSSTAKRTTPKNIDQITLYRGMLTVDGWSKAGPPVVTYRGEVPTTWQCYKVQRTDVAEIHGAAASDWGFALRAIIGRPPILQDQFVIIFPDGDRIVAPQITRVTAPL